MTGWKFQLNSQRFLLNQPCTTYMQADTWYIIKGDNMKTFKKRWLAPVFLVLGLAFGVSLNHMLDAATVNITGNAMSGLIAYADSLTAPGNFSTLVLYGFSSRVETITEVTFQITTTAINTSVTVRAEGSLDGVNWWNMDDSGDDTTYTDDETNAMRYYGVSSLYAVRLVWVSEAGGTDGKIAVIAKAG